MTELVQVSALVLAAATVWLVRPGWMVDWWLCSPEVKRMVRLMDGPGWRGEPVAGQSGWVWFTHPEAGDLSVVVGEGFAAVMLRRECVSICGLPFYEFACLMDAKKRFAARHGQAGDATVWQLGSCGIAAHLFNGRTVMSVVTAVADLAMECGRAAGEFRGSVGDETGEAYQKSFQAKLNALATAVEGKPDAERAALRLIDAGHRLARLLDADDCIDDIEAWDEVVNEAFGLLGIVDLTPADDE